MSTTMIRDESFSSPPLRAFADWLRHLSIAASLPATTAQHLPDHYLADIGVDRRNIERSVERATTRLGLLDIGWQKPGRGSIRRR